MENDRNIPIDRAEHLCLLAERIGMLGALQQTGVREFPVPYRTRLQALSIDELNLSVRSSNGLKRAGISTLGLLWELLLKENGLLSIRNLGQKSAREIRRAFLAECYARLQACEKAEYWQEVLTPVR